MCTVKPAAHPGRLAALRRRTRSPVAHRAHCGLAGRHLGCGHRSDHADSARCWRRFGAGTPTPRNFIGRGSNQSAASVGRNPCRLCAINEMRQTGRFSKSLLRTSNPVGIGVKNWIQTLKGKAYIVIANAQPANDLLEPGVGVPAGAFRLTNRPDQLLQLTIECDRTWRRDDCWATKSGCSPDYVNDRSLRCFG